MKKIIFVFCFLIITSKAVLAYDNSINYETQFSCSEISQTADYTYERVFSDGMWWIYVYDEDGALVNIYPDV